MKVLILGGGGREHALAWSFSQPLNRSPAGAAPQVEIVCAPGNGGIAALARCVPVRLESVESMLDCVQAEAPCLVVVGPEVPLAAGIVDALQARGVPIFGPTQAAARLESSKAFAKEFMQRWRIPTAAYAVCASLAEVETALSSFGAAVVVKADGLAAGKGVVMARTHAQALAVAAEMFAGTLLGAPVESLVLEETLTGPEVSYFALCDGRRAVTLAFAQDHKRIGEGDTGPNTGGMGAYSTDDLVSAEQAAWMHSHIAQRVVDGMAAEGTPFTGVLFTGLMLTPDGPKVLEFNTRFGDPETEAVLMRLQTPLLDLLEAAVGGRLDEAQVVLRPGAAACVVAASAGYPTAYAVGEPISGLERVPKEVVVFHAGTALKDGVLVTAGGRVLAVSSAAADLRSALDAVYGALSSIEFKGMQYRRDIGWRALG